jgi:hypothetical protein
VDGQMSLAAAGLALVVYLAVTSIPVSKRLKHLQREIQKDKIRNSWADARVIMYRLAREGKLSVHSATFAEFVRLQTYILRRPDEYQEISRLLLDSILRMDQNAKPEFQHEVDSWPEEMRDVLGYMLVGTYDLIRSRFRGRLLFFLVRKVIPIVRIGRKLDRFVRKSFPDEQRLFSAASRLERMQHAA